jgi:chromosome segregation ATPase
MISDSNPVFVKIDKYKEILDIIEVVDKKITNVRQIISDLNELKAKEEEEIMTWEKNVEEISHKIGSIKDELQGN